jgi:hypothetical protein
VHVSPLALASSRHRARPWHAAGVQEISLGCTDDGQRDLGGQELHLEHLEAPNPILGAEILRDREQTSSLLHTGGEGQ